MMNPEPVSPEPSIFDQADPAADERAMLEGEAAADAGRVVPHAEVAEWLATWGTADEQPAPAKGFKSSGPRLRSQALKPSAPTLGNST
jgi:predicted transcriptional regulator